MKKFSKIFASFVAVFALTFAMTSCGGSDKEPAKEDEPTTQTPGGSTTVPTSNEVTYRVRAVAVSGKPLKNFNVVLSKDGQMVQEKYTDVNGYADFTLEKGLYKINVDDEDGYSLESNAMVFTDPEGEELVKEIKFTQHVIDSPLSAGAQYEVGDSMHDFEYTDDEGNQVILSKLLEEKDVVVLNFWYSECSWCNTEFPYLEEAYQNYKDDVAVIAVNAGAQASSEDTMSDVKEFKKNNNLSFPCVIDTYDAGLCRAFVRGGYPTTAIIDRYGVVCVIEEGAVTTTSKWENMFNDYLGEDYQTKYESEEIAVPTTTYPGDDAIANAANANENVSISYKNETGEDATYNWPWVVDSETGAVKPSNTKINNSYSIVHMNVNIKANQVLAFDYKISSELDADALYILSNGRSLGLVSGKSEAFETKYIYVAGEDEEVEISLCYLKDKSGYDGDDTVYIKNVRFVDVSEVDTPTYIVRDCANGEASQFTHQYESYSKVVLNENDGYYHVNDVNGPLVFANLIDRYTKWSENSIFDYQQEGKLDFTATGGRNLTTLLYNYMLYASNSKTNYLGLAISGLTPVTMELKAALDEVVKNLGHESAKENENQWLEVCVYIDQYGTNGEDTIGDPIKGLATFSSYEAQLGTNTVEYDRILVPRGLYNKFVPTESGVYKIHAIEPTAYETDCFIFNSKGEMIKTVTESDVEFREFYFNAYKETDLKHFFTYIRLDANEEYYVAPCFWNTAQMGTITFSIDFVAPTHSLYRVCAYAPFTSANEDLTGEILAYKTIDVRYDEINDCYHPIINDSVDENKKIYVDISLPTGAFSNMNLVQVANLGGFDFSKDENGNALESPTEEQIDKTSIFNEYVPLASDVETDKNFGLVEVNKELADLLQQLMDKYTFEGVRDSWLKLCYYEATL